MVNWTMLPYMTPLWKQMLEFPATSERKTLFFDLADPEKRSPADILDALQTLARFQQNHDVILGLNEKEAIQVGQNAGRFDAGRRSHRSPKRARTRRRDSRDLGNRRRRGASDQIRRRRRRPKRRRG